MTNRKKILVVDDDSTLRLGMQTVLRENGYQTLEADDGMEARDLIYEQQPDLVILDMMMPRWGGFAVLEHFEKVPTAPPFIMLTAHDGAKHKAYARQVGVADFLHKPCSMKHLLQKIDFVFQAHGRAATQSEGGAATTGEAEVVKRAARLLLVQVHEPLSRMLKRYLEAEGFEVESTHDAAEAERQVRASAFDVIVLDLMRPSFDSLEVIAEWRKSGISTDILALTGPDSVEVKVKALNAGADVCMGRPFHLLELLARMRVLIRRRVPPRDSILRVHDLEIDPSARTVRRGGMTILLTAREYSLLECLASKPGQVMTRSMIWQHLNPGQLESSTNIIDVYIRYLRTKLDSGFGKKLILTRWGEGYLMRGESD